MEGKKIKKNLKYKINFKILFLFQIDPKSILDPF